MESEVDVDYVIYSKIIIYIERIIKRDGVNLHETVSTLKLFRCACVFFLFFNINLVGVGSSRDEFFEILEDFALFYNIDKSVSLSE